MGEVGQFDCYAQLGCGGSYEVTTSSYQPGGGELLVEGAVKLLAELKKDKGP